MSSAQKDSVVIGLTETLVPRKYIKTTFEIKSLPHGCAMDV
jgi:hypothetical protein